MKTFPKLFITNDEPKFFYFYSCFSQIFDPFDSYENYPEEKNRYRESILVAASSRRGNAHIAEMTEKKRNWNYCLNVK